MDDYQKWLFHRQVFAYPARMPILLEDLNLRKAERTLCHTALQKGGSIVEAAQLLGITRHALKRRMIKHQIEWPPKAAERVQRVGSPAEAPVAMHTVESP
jgi:transcriptional regulator of acetoin/glycerol metabolism